MIFHDAAECFHADREHIHVRVGTERTRSTNLKTGVRLIKNARNDFYSRQLIEQKNAKLAPMAKFIFSSMDRVSPNYGRRSHFIRLQRHFVNNLWNILVIW